METTQQVIEKIDTGIEGLNTLLYGGLPKGRSYLVSGESGTGKTIFSLQFLLKGLQQQEKCIYITIDEKPKHVILDAASLGWDLNPYLESGLLKIIDVTSYFGAQKGPHKSSDIDVDRVITDIIGYVKSSGATRLAIDPIAPLIFSHDIATDVIDYIRRLIFSLEEIANCTTVLTSYVPVGSNKLSTLGVEEFAASGIIVLKLSTTDNKRIRCIGVRKMRATRIDLTEFSFEILPNRGLVLRQPA